MSRLARLEGVAGSDGDRHGRVALAEAGRGKECECAMAVVAAVEGDVSGGYAAAAVSCGGVYI